MNFIPNYTTSAYDYTTYEFKHVIKPISPDILKFAENNINRQSYIFNIFDKIRNYNDAIIIEKGIFEFTILYSISHNCPLTFIPKNYESKFIEIYENLEQNMYLYDKIMNDDTFELYNVAFLKNSELNPKKWKKILDKQIYREWKEKNVEFTDEYECDRCGQRKSRITQQQNRGTDEAMTIFVSCVVCGRTVTINND